METKLKKQALIDTINALSELIDGWNDDSADEDRGRGNDALCLLIFDDGSGKLGTQFGDVFNQQIGFDNPEELVQYLEHLLDFAEEQ